MDDLTRFSTEQLRAGVRGAHRYQWGPFMYATVETRDVKSWSLGVWFGMRCLQLSWTRTLP